MDDARKKYIWEDIAKATKPKDFFIAQYLNRPLSRRLTYFIANYTKITPNQITLIGFLITLVACSLFLMEGFIFRTIGAILLEIACTFDCVDGELARLKNLYSKKGAILDAFSDRVGVSLAVICLSLGYFFSADDHLVLILCIFAILFMGLSDIIGHFLEISSGSNRRDNFSSELGSIERMLNRLGIKKLGFKVGYGPDTDWFIISICAIFFLVYPALLFFILIRFLLVVYMVYKIYLIKN